jgi:hypothetical protein
MPTPPRRRWYQFSLRTMLIVMVLSSAVFGWWGHRSKEWIRQRHSVKVFKGAVGQVRAPGGLWIFGEEGVGEIFAQPPDWERAESLFPEAKFAHARWKK